MRIASTVWACALTMAGWAAPLSAGTVVSFSQPDFDRWMYPFSSTPGVRATASTFGAPGQDSFDDYDAQFLLGFNTAAAGVPTSVPSGFRLQINSVRVTATHTTGSFDYDPTHDDFTSYLDASDPEVTVDGDPGRPIELFGVGLRNGFAALGFGPTAAGPPIFEESEAYRFGSPLGKAVRNAFAWDPAAGDVSNVLADRLWSTTPWAVGTTDLDPGDPVVQSVAGVSAGNTFAFEVDLSRSDVLAYLEAGLANGGLFFSVVSLHSVGMTGGTNPNFYTRDNFDPAKIAPTLAIDYELVPIPEPASGLLALCGAVLLACWRRRSA